MKLKPLEIKFKWSNDVPLYELRHLILDKLNKYGSPLRWSIVDISIDNEKNVSREVKVEAVVITQEELQP